MTGGLIKTTSGKIMASSGGKPVKAGGATVVSPTQINPQSVTALSDAVAGSVLTPLSFTGFSYTPQTAPPLILVNNAGGRVTLSGNWEIGYVLAVGASGLLSSGNFAISLQFAGTTDIYNIALTVTNVASAVTLFTSTVENADTIPTLADQEVSFGQPFVKGDVPVGSIVRPVIGGNAVPSQLSERIYWNDGSLKHALVRMTVPAMAVGATQTISWQRVAGTWNDAPLHTTPAAITGNVVLEYAFSSWKGRTSANVLTAERGPLQLNSAVMFNTARAPAPTIDKVMSGPLCNEWRVMDMATVGSTAGSKHPNQGGYLYARCWGGTATVPKRIQFLFRSVYGWSTDVAADEQGLQVSLDLKVNGTTVRGAGVATPGWSGVNTWKGGFVVSANTEGDMDWYDVATASFFTPPRIVYRHNVTYGVQAKYFPPFDTANTAYPMTAGTQSYLPGKRGPLRANQSDVADHEMIPWTTPKPPANCQAAYARATAAQIHGHIRYCRAAGFGMGAMTNVALHRDTRKVISYIPPAKQSNLSVLGTSIYGLGKPAQADPALRPEIINLDPSHMPSMAFWPALVEGDQHWLDLMYHEVTLPGLFEAPGDGFFGTSDRAKIPFGGICWRGQIRGVGHNARALLAGVGLGRPSDPHHQMAVDYFSHWVEMTREIPIEEDAWRLGGGIDATDGRRFQDLKLLRPNNEPTYKFWMHSFGLMATAYGYGFSENEMARERADWWSHAITVMSGGWTNDIGAQYYLMKPDPIEVAGYLSICMDGVSKNTNRYWHFGQWANAVSQVTYQADGQTLTFAGPSQGLTAMENGMIITVGGIRDGNEPHWVTDNTKVPTGLTRGVPYYVVQASGLNCKISLSVGGSPVTFNTGGVAMVGSCARRTVNGVNTMRTGAVAPTASNSYLVQVMSSLDMYQHYVAPSDARVLLARRNLFNLKNGSPAPNAYDERGKTTVPRDDAPTNQTGPWTQTGSSTVDNGSDSTVKITSIGSTEAGAQRQIQVEPTARYTLTFTTDKPINYTIEDSAS